MIDGPIEAFTCLVGTMVQEAYGTSPAVRDACAASILGHAATLEPDFQAALDARGGIAPDVEVPVSEADFFALNDVQLKKALELMQTRIGFQKPAATSAHLPR